MTRLLSTAGLARVSARRPWLVIGLWVVLLVLAGIAQTGLSDVLTNQDNFTNKPESVQAEDRLEDRLRGERPLTETVIVRADGATVDDAAFRAKVEQVQAGLLDITGAVKVAGTTYYTVADAGDPAAANLVSADRTTTIIPVTMVGDFDDAKEYGADYMDAVAAMSGGGFAVMTVGDVSQSEEWGRIAEEDLRKGEGIGVLAALVVLVIVFGALIAAGVPLLLAIASIVVALGLTALVGRLFPLSDIVTSMISMIGLAVGIDYALFVVERYREERRAGLAKLDAIEMAGATSTKAVVFSGLTVVIALLGMFIIPVTAFRSLGIGAALVVLVAVAATTTLIPALLSLLGDKINWPRRVKYDAAAQTKRHADDQEMIHGGFWGRITRIVMAHPVISAVLATAFLIAAALPVLDLKTGQPGVESLPAGEVKTAYTILQNEFYAGMVAPVEIVIDGPAADPSVQAGVGDLLAAIDAAGDFGPATIVTNPTGDLTLVSAPLAFDPNSPAAEDAVKELRTDVIPAAFEGVDADVYVGGGAAVMLDFNEILADYTPLVFAFVLGLSFLLLMVAFRSIVVPLKAIVLNLLSVGAAYGLVVLVFQKGVGAELFGFQETPVITAWLPIFLFSVLFGLSMDYHVFLLSRIREHYDQTKRNGESVAVGLQATARLITGAAVIMVAVFGGFASGRLVDLQQMGFGLAVAVFLDATIVRSVLVPAGMALLGDRNWYLPRRLRWLPNLSVEGTPSTARPIPVPVVATVASPLPASSGD